MSTHLIILLICIFIIYFTVFMYFMISNLAKRKLNTKCWVINLPKNKQRLQRFTYFYNQSDISKLPLETFSAIKGRELDAEKYLSFESYKVLLESEKQKYRTKHYQLTRGAIGCYLSHTTIYKKLINDPKYNYYIIFEDDAAILPKVLNKLETAITYAPADWDMILFAPIMEVISEKTVLFKKYETFWGLCAYVINKKGAKKFIKEFNARPISMQIDSKMSLMIMQDKLNVYGYRDTMTWHDRSMGTDIQMQLKKIPNINPFYIEDL